VAAGLVHAFNCSILSHCDCWMRRTTINYVHEWAFRFNLRISLQPKRIGTFTYRWSSKALDRADRTSRNADSRMSFDGSWSILRTITHAIQEVSYTWCDQLTVSLE
jgi:hypothetical protein